MGNRPASRQYQSTASPIERLPPELLSDIFTRTVEWEYDHRPPSLKESPLVLTLVSHTWRIVTFSTPILWSSLAYYIAVGENTDVQNALDGVRAWLERSGDVALSLAIWIYTNDDGVGNAFLKMYYEHSHRWRLLKLGLGGSIGAGLLPPPSGGFPLLEGIDSQLWDDSHIKWSLPFYEGPLPRLCHLKHRELVAGTRIQPGLDAILPQLAHLETARNVLPVHITDVLRSCVSLETCDMYFRPAHTSPPPVSKELFSLHKLHNLRIRVKFGFGFEDIFESIALPALSVLTIVGAFWPWPSFIPFLNRSKCALRVLTLPGTNIKEDELIEMMRVVGDTLTALTIGVQYQNEVPDGKIPVTDKSLELLNARVAGKDVLLPNATSLNFRAQGELEWTDGAFADMVESRWQVDQEPSEDVQGNGKTAAKVEHIALSGSRASGNEHTEDVRRLRKIAKQGLDIYCCIS